MTRAYIGLGSNVGDRLAFMRSAIAVLRAEAGVEVVQASGVYETAPVGPAQPDFLNAVLEIWTTLSPLELLSTLKRIERECGRIARERWGPREIDLDLLLYGDEEIVSDELTVPHPRMAGRAFVQIPLADLDPALAQATEDDGVRRFGGAELLLG